MKFNVILPALLAAQLGPTDFEILQKCREMDHANSRVDCYDSFVDSRTDLASVGGSTKSDAEYSSLADTVPIEVSGNLFGRSHAEASRIVESKLEIQRISQINETVVKVVKSKTKKLTLELRNGQVWRQLDGKVLRLQSGDSVVIREGSLGSYLLEKQSGSRRIRVRRIQ